MIFDKEQDRYVLTEEEKEDMFAKGWNRCEVCKEPFWLPRTATKCIGCDDNNKLTTWLDTH